MALPKILEMLFENSGLGPLLRSDIIPFDGLLTAILAAFDTAITNCGGTPPQD